MDIQAILSGIDAEIAKLRLARDLLSGGKMPIARKGGALTVGEAKAGKKRILSEEARARIAAAQRKRWAAARKAVE